MSLIQLNEHCYYFNSAVNIGYVHQGDYGLIVDAGIDQSSIRKVVRELEQKDLPITHLFISHAHADHYGGATYLIEKYSVKTIAPRFETVILNNPIIEPIYLFYGNEPLPELRNKFLEGPAIEIDIVVDEGINDIDGFQCHFISCPGHSYNQMALAIHNILFAADSYFGEVELQKHKIPYLTNVELALSTLEKLLETNYDGAVPGHGKFETNYKSTVQKNIEYLENILHRLASTIEHYPDGISHEQLVQHICSEMGVDVKNLSQYLLFKTAITGYLTYLINHEKIEHYIQHNCWMFKI